LTLQFDTNATHVVELTPVTPLNEVPVATGGTAQAVSGVAVPVILTGTDANGDSLSFSIASNPSNGVLTGTAPNMIYTSNAQFTGADSFTYRVSDGVAESSVATFNIQVSAAPVQNTAPVANELILEALSGQGLAFTLSGSDDENQTLSFQMITPPANGTLSGTAPNLVYTPNTGFTGRDELEFVVNDSIENSAPGKVIFNVDSQLVQVVGTVSNTAPAITIDGNLSEWSAMTAFDADPQDVSGANNDIDWRDATMAHNATDFFIAYREHGPAGLTWGNQIFIDTDTDASTGFKGFSEEFTIGADFLIEGDALFRYVGDPQSIQNDWLWQFLGSVDSGLNGNSAEIKVSRAQLENSESMLLFFYGNSTATGGSSIDYYPDNANDPAAALRTRHFSYSVNPNNANGNIAPIAFAQQVQVSSGTSYQLTLTGFDFNGDSLTYIIDQTPQSGTLTGTAPNLVYTPDTGTTQDLITYRVSDGSLSSAVATVAIDVLPPVPVNQAPTANGQSLTVAYQQPLNVVLSGGDPEQTQLGFTVLTQPQGGVLSGTAPNLVYTPDAGFTGADSFTFKVDDGDLDSPSATVTIDVAPPANGGAVSNPVASLSVDGSLADWNGLLSLGDDPADVGGVRANNPLDWRQAWAAHSTSDLYIAYRNHETFSLSWGHGIYIDTDGDINTGFRGFSGEFPIGADILIETDDVQQYTGSGTNWGWSTIAQATVATNGEIGELSAPLSALGNPQNLRFYFRANNTAFGGNTLDHFPDAANDPSADAITRSLAYKLTP